MKTLVITGAARQKGHTNQMVKLFLDTLGGDYDIIDAYRVENVAPCKDCRYCWHKKGCSIKDGMQEIYEKVEKAQVLVLASPLYFSTLTGPLLALCSRFQALYMARRNRGSGWEQTKGGLVLLTGGGSTKDPSCAFRTSRIILREMGAGEIRQVASIGTDHLPAGEDEEALRQAVAAAREFNTLFA